MSESNSSPAAPQLPPLNLPPAELKIISDGKATRVYDMLRHKYVAFTPEEYVRQLFVNHLVTNLHYPMSLTANEVKINLNNTSKRCDTIVYAPGGNPLVIVEYKAPNVQITQDVFDQIVRYNMVLRAKYLIVSNGLNHYVCVIDYPNSTYHFIAAIPDYRDIAIDLSQN